MSTEQQLAELNVEKFRAELGPFVVAAQSTRMPMVFTDVQEDKKPIIFANDSFVELTGYTREELLGKDFLDLVVHHNNLEAVAKVVAAFSVTPKSDLETNYRRKDGTEFFASLFVHPVVGKDGGKVQHFVSLIDLTPARTASSQIEFQSSLLDAVGEAVIATDLDGKVAYWNHAAEALYGWSRAEVLGRQVEDQLQSFSVEEHSSAIWRPRKVVQTGSVVVKRRDGRTFPARVTGAPTYGPNGSLTGSVYISADISDELQKKAELELKNDQLQVTLENIFQGLVVADAEGRITLCNTRAAALLDLPVEFLLSGATLHEVMERLARRELVRSDVILGRSIASDTGQHEWTTPNGTVLEVRTLPLPDGGTVRTFTDHTARHHADEALQASEARFRALVTATSAIIWRATADGVIFEVDQRSGEDGRWRPDLGTNWRDFADGGDQPRVDAAWRAFVDDGNLEDIEFAFRSAATDQRWMRCRAVPLVRSDGTVDEWVGTVHDIHGDREREERLLLRDRSLEAIAEGVIITDARQADNPIIYVNAAFESITGFSREEASGRNCRFLQGPGSDPNVVSTLRAALSRREVFREKLVNYKKNGDPFDNELSIAPVFDGAGDLTHFVGIQSDVTSREMQAAQLRQAQKMELVGQLTGGIAHDFNNLLTVILGNAEAIAEDMSCSLETRGLSEMIVEAADGGARLTERLLAFGRRQTLAPIRLELERVVSNMLPLLQRAVGAQIPIITEFHKVKSWCLADRALLESCLLNLVVNSRDVMQEGGTITITTGRRSRRPGEHARIQVEQLATVSVVDTGKGMSADVVSRVFEPFFTTKEVGKGSGLGLSMVYGFAVETGGAATVFSMPGHGTTVEIALPSLPDIDYPKGVVFDEAAAEEPRQNELARVLLVEDEPEVLRLAARNLSSLGYDVVTATNGSEALEILARDPTFTLLFTDLVLPKGMSGIELSRFAKELAPTMKVLFTSGYSEEMFRNGPSLDDDVPLLRKPYRRRELAEMLARVLEVSTPQ